MYMYILLIRNIGSPIIQIFLMMGLDLINLNLSLSGVPIPNMQLDHSFDFDHACIVYNLVLVLNCFPFALRCSKLDVIARRQ